MWTYSPTVNERRNGARYKDRVRLPDDRVHVRYDGTVTACGRFFYVPARVAPTTDLTCEFCDAIETVDRD